MALPKATVQAGVSEARFTTGEQLALEHDLLDSASRGLNSCAGGTRTASLESALAGRDLSKEQQQVVVELCGRGDEISVVRAAAGTGKTFVLDAAREAWQRDRLDVVGVALSARAALELSDRAGIPSMTIAQLTHRLSTGTVLPQRCVLIVDEAGMVGTRDLANLAKATASAHGKLVLVGDDRQLPELQAGGAFHALAERLPSSTLREVRRQHESWDRQALDALRSGDVEVWAQAYRDHGRITVAETASATRTALVNDWARSTGDKLMIAARREDVAELNHLARRHLQDTGRLAADELSFAGRSFTTGDRIVGARNDRKVGILNGQRGAVRGIDPHARVLEVRLDDGSYVRVPTEYLEAGHLEHGYAITAHRAQGATVDRTFVLGGEELYREWGYTALSRHRDQARFYIARGDLRTNPELPPARDPLVAGIAALLERSNAKGLAIDALPRADRDELELTRRLLREQLAGQPPPRRLPHLENNEVNEATRALEGARRHRALLLEQRAQLKRFDRRGRADLDRRLDDNETYQQRCQLRLSDATAARAAGIDGDRDWLSTHGPHAAQLLAVDAAARTHDLADAQAARRLAALDRNPLDQTLDRSHHTLDLGR